MPIISVKPKCGYSWLEGRGLPVYGYKESNFLIWDPILREWTWIPICFCCGD